MTLFYISLTAEGEARPTQSHDYKLIEGFNLALKINFDI
jgi:hypothetical protein